MKAVVAETLSYICVLKYRRNMKADLYIAELQSLVPLTSSVSSRLSEGKSCFPPVYL